MKKFIIAGLSIAMLLSLAACGSESDTSDGGIEKKEDETQVNIANPFVESETLEKSIELADFKIVLPENMPDGYEIADIRTIEEEMIEVTYRDQEEDNEITIRKAKGSDDISGDYNQYHENNIIEIGEMEVNTKGNNGLVNVAIWTKGEYTFAVLANQGGEGIQTDIAIDIISNIE